MSINNAECRKQESIPSSPTPYSLLPTPSLLDYLSQYPRIGVAFSGGVDSSYLLYAAKAAGCDVRAYIIKSQFQPQFEFDDAVRLADSIGVPLTVGMFDALDDPNIVKNPSDRCYYCKNAILSKLWELAEADGVSVLCDGSNADDDASDRPGMRALREHGVLSPLRDCGLTKADIRRLSKQAGLFTHDKPSYACLATRIPANTVITGELLDKVERAESALFDMGFSDFRVRLMPPDGAKLQVSAVQWSLAAARREEILAALQPYFVDVVLDFSLR